RAKSVATKPEAAVERPRPGVLERTADVVPAEPGTIRGADARVLVGGTDPVPTGDAAVETPPLLLRAAHAVPAEADAAIERAALHVPEGAARAIAAKPGAIPRTAEDVFGAGAHAVAANRGPAVAAPPHLLG